MFHVELIIGSNNISSITSQFTITRVIVVLGPLSKRWIALSTRINHYSRLVFTSDAVVIGIVSEVSRTTELEFSFDSFKNSVAYDKLKTTLSESEAEAEG